MSGLRADRPGLARALDALRQGDSLVHWRECALEDLATITAFIAERNQDVLLRDGWKATESETGLHAVIFPDQEPSAKPPA
jgi:hypothetical protein